MHVAAFTISKVTLLVGTREITKVDQTLVAQTTQWWPTCMAHPTWIFLVGSSKERLHSQSIQRVPARAQCTEQASTRRRLWQTPAH